MQLDNISQLSVRCFKCGCFGHRGMECERRALGNPNGHFEKCWICGCLGHIAVECKEKTVTCFSCGARGHKQEDCVSAMANCWNCGEKGHIKRTCPLKKNVGMCFYCHEVGHHSKECNQKACFNCSSKDHLWTRCPLKGSRGVRRRPKRQTREIRHDEVRPFSFPLMFQTGYNNSFHGQNTHERENYSTSFKTNSTPLPMRSNSSPLPLSAPLLPRQQDNRTMQSLDELDLAQLSFEHQYEGFGSSRQVQQSTTPRQDSMDLVDILGPLYQTENSPPLTTSATIRANSVPAIPNGNNMWGAIAQEREASAEELPSWTNTFGSSWNNGLPTPFAREKLVMKERKKDMESPVKEVVKFEIDSVEWTAQSETPPLGLISVSPVVSETSNNTSQSLKSGSTDDVMVTTEEDQDLESTPMSKSQEPSKSGEQLVEELKRVKMKLAETKRKLSKTTEQLEKTQEVVANLQKIIDLESEVKTKFSRLSQERNNKCASCIDRLKAFDSCKNCVNRS